MESKSIFTSGILRLTGILTFMILIVLTAAAGDSPKSYYDGIIKINPDCKIKRMSNGDVIVYAKDQGGADVKHQFNDFYADLLMAAYRKQRIEFIVDTFSKKYYLSEADCRREIKHALNILGEWNIIIRDDQIAAR
jgi:hypothetical protein